MPLHDVRTACGDIERGIPDRLRLTLLPSISVLASRSTTDLVESRYSIHVCWSTLSFSNALVNSHALSVYSVPMVSSDLRNAILL